LLNKINWLLVFGLKVKNFIFMWNKLFINSIKIRNGLTFLVNIQIIANVLNCVYVIVKNVKTITNQTFLSLNFFL
jgi:hypothetical protein